MAQVGERRHSVWASQVRIPEWTWLFFRNTVNLFSLGVGLSLKNGSYSSFFFPEMLRGGSSPAASVQFLVLIKTYFNIAEIDHQRWLVENGQCLENVDWTHLVLACGKIVLQRNHWHIEKDFFARNPPWQLILVLRLLVICRYESPVDFCAARWPY